MPSAAVGRAVLVTGGSGGIGAAIARVFADSGDRVAVHYRSGVQRAETVLASLPGDGHISSQADLSDPDAVFGMVERVATVFGGIDVLVNNAGIYTSHPIDDTDYATWQRAWHDTLAVNLVGAANVTWCAARHMDRGGRIVNVASRGAFRGEPRQPAYGASKAGLVAFGQSLARALGPRGISVTSVAPGITETEMATISLAGDDAARRRGESPLNRITSPEDVAAAVFYLASSAAEMASGSVLDLNGASHLRL